MDLSKPKPGPSGAAGGGPSSPSGASGGDAAAAQLMDTTPAPPPVRHSKEGDLHIFGSSHDTVIYHGDDVITTAPAAAPEEEDDTFFEVEVEKAHNVTPNDVKSMYKDLQRRRENLEDAPLKGQKLRALEKETATLKSLHDHPNTVIRIRFPDRIILQGIFRTSDTISSVKAWLREYLNDPSLDFYIFTAPPKKVLQEGATLLDERLIAMVVIYFGSQFMPEDNKVLKAEFYNRLSDPEKAFDLAKNKLRVRKRESQIEEGEVKPSTETQLKDHPDDSTRPQPQQPVKRTADKGTVPKWFKMK